ncbi:MAG: transglycosylase domain-containing protein, partial [Firmicutes bacterium]|nr:transglycosylase domain-containing protein [Bacillota bacterium]
MTEQTRRERFGHKSKRKRKVSGHKQKRGFALVGLAMSVTLGTAVGSVAYLLHDAPALRISAFTHLSAATLLFAEDHKTLLGRFAADGDRRPLRSLASAGPLVQDAFIAAEDKDYYHHIGVDPGAILRSAWTDARSRHVTSGGSTITQQTVKLALFPRQERTLRRKVQEMALAIGLERMQNKRQILLEYLNALYFGSIHGVHVYGAQSAALHLFGKPSDQLSAAQAAVVAAIPNNPSYFSVSRHPERVWQRERLILRRMHEQGFLSDATYRQALMEPVQRELSQSPLLSAAYESGDPFIAAQVSRLAPALIAKAEGVTLQRAEQQLETGGLHIYTSIDASLQKRMDKAAAMRDFPAPMNYTYSDQRGKHTALHAQESIGAVVIQNGTGRVVAVCGGRNFSQSEIDHATMRRQPGSALKPLVVYGPAIEQKIITPGTIVDDAPHHYPDPNAPKGDWFPLNWDGKFHGLMTARDALMESYNSPAIELLGHLGVQTGARYGRSMGLMGINHEDEQSLGLAIGGISGGVSPWELAGAYATLPTGGIYTPPTLIDSIEDADGHVIYLRSAPHARVLSATTSALLTHMLQTVITSPYGTAHRLFNLSRVGDIAGKTGTTDNDNDAWFTGFTPRYTMSVWAGYDIPHPLPVHNGIRESMRPLTVFAQTLGPTIRAQHEHFGSTPGVKAYEICTKSGQLAGPLCIAAHETETDFLPESEAPQKVCQLHTIVQTTVLQGHTFLATDFTPPDEVREEILLDRLPDS